MTTEPKWLTWARDLQAIAQTGLTYGRGQFDRERYETLRALASTIMASHTGASAERIEALFADETGYATPKVDVRAAVFDNRDRLLMVREAGDGNRWTLPGGWADVNLTAAENVAKEVREESGYVVQVRKLAAVFDRTRQGTRPEFFPVTKSSFCAMLRAVKQHLVWKRRRSDGSRRTNCRIIFRWIGYCRARSGVCFNTTMIQYAPPTSTKGVRHLKDKNFSEWVNSRP